MATWIAPPVVAGNAWFAINGRGIDAIALGLAGTPCSMAIVKLAPTPAHRTAVVRPVGGPIVPVRRDDRERDPLASVEHVHYQAVWTSGLLAPITVFVAISRAAHGHRDETGTPSCPVTPTRRPTAVGTGSGDADANRRLGRPAGSRATIRRTPMAKDSAAHIDFRVAARVRSTPGWRYRERATPTTPRSRGPHAVARALISLIRPA